MRIVRVFKHRFDSLFRGSRVDSALRSEIELHIDQLAKELMAEGMTESEARMAARREFGPVALTAEQCRDARRVHFIEDFARDLAFAIRALRKSPGFTLTALLSLALGIGANTAIYSFLDAVLMRALPVPDPQSLVILNWHAKGWPKVAHAQHGDGYEGPGDMSFSGTFPYPFFESLGSSNGALSSIFGFADAGRLNLVVQNQAFLAGGVYVSGNFFTAIGAPPAAGRLIGNEDDRVGANRVAVISFRLAQERFDGALAAAGRTILINQTPFTIAGVTAPEFYGINQQDAPDIYLPLAFVRFLDPRAKTSDWFHERNTYWIEMMGRLRHGVSLRQAEVEMAGRFHAFVTGTAVNDKERLDLPELWLQEGGSGLDSLRRKFSKPLYVLLVMTSLILAIACSNIANLLLSRATTRRREIAVRLSLGAGRLRIIRQLLTESVLIALLGGVLGLLVAASAIRLLTWLLSNGQWDFAVHASIDGRILLFAVSVSVLTGILFGLVPAIQATKVDVAPALKESRAAAARVKRFGLPFGLSQTLVAGQIALSLLLVIAAGLFVRTLLKLNSVSIGFNTEKLLLFTLDATQAGYTEHRASVFNEALRERFATVPGVRAATMTDMPLLSEGTGSTSIIVPGMPAPRDHPLGTNVLMIGPPFFHTMQIPILRGRAVGEQDMAQAPRVVVVNQVFDKFFHGRNLIGQHFAFEPGDKPLDVQIVGLARNSLYSSLKSAVPPVAYVPLGAAALARHRYVLRAADGRRSGRV